MNTYLRTGRMIACLALALLSVTVVAGEGDFETDARTVEPGTETRAWLELQRSGQQASAKAQTISGPVLKSIHERYIESFSQPMPDLTTENARRKD